MRLKPAMRYQLREYLVAGGFFLGDQRCPDVTEHLASPTLSAGRVSGL